MGLLVVASVPGAARAQDRPSARWEIRKCDFRSDGVWRKQARQVAKNRARLLGRRQFGALNAPLVGGGGVAPSGAAVAVSGVLRVPALLFKFRDTPAAQVRAAAEYDRSEEHTSELQSRLHLVCRLLLEKKNTNSRTMRTARSLTIAPADP